MITQRSPYRRTSFSAAEAAQLSLGDALAEYRITDRKPLTTGFPRLDEYLGGLRPGELTLLGGRPSMGKTALALNIARNIARSNGNWLLYVNPDLSADIVGAKLICQEADVDYWNFARKTLDQEERRLVTDSARVVSEYAIEIMDDGFPSLRRIAERAAALRKRFGPNGCLVIDGLAAFTLSPTIKDTRRKATICLSRFKKLARKIEIPVLVTSNLNRELEQRAEKWPRLGDLPTPEMLRYADNAVFLYVEEFYKPDTSWKGEAQVLIGRSRTGRIGGLTLKRFASGNGFAEKEFNSVAA